MRRCLALLLTLAVALAVAACGSSKSSAGAGGSASGPGGARAAELAYFPQGSPFVATITTSPSDGGIENLMGLLGHFPLVAYGEQALMSKLQQKGIDYTTDIKPLLGSPVTIGFASGSTAVDTNRFLAVWQVASASRLQALLHKLPRVTKSGSLDGASLYTLGSAHAAVDGSTLVISSDATDVTQALQRNAAHSGFSNADYQQLVSGLPSDPLIEAFGDLQGVLAQPAAAQAAVVPWVHALKGYGVALGATQTGLTLNFRVDTTGATLTTSQLPIAPGSSAPSFAGKEPITVSLHNPGQSVTFIEQTVKATDPSQLKGIPAAGLQAITQLEGQLTGNLVIGSDLHTTIARAQLQNPQTALAELTKIIATGNGHPTPLGGGFYHSGDVTFGIADGQLLVGRASPAVLKAFAAEPLQPTSGSGTAAFRLDLVPLISLALSHSASGSEIAGALPTILQQIGELTGSVSASTSALTGSATLAIH